MAIVSIGIDIGQRVDPTALAVAELDLREPNETDHWLIRHLERLPLGTPYPEVAERLGAVIAGARTIAASRGDRYPPTFRAFADATGVGLPVVDLMRTAGRRVTPCLFTYGNRRTVENDQVTIGKGYLVSRLQALLQTNRIHLPDTAEARALAQELLDYQIRVDERANDTYGAFKAGRHDDLVTALGLAVQEKPRQWRAY